MSHFIVQVATMPSGSKFGSRGRVAILEVEDGYETVSMISLRARGVIRIVSCTGSLNMGKTSRSAYGSALAAAEGECAFLNAELAERVALEAWVAADEDKRAQAEHDEEMLARTARTADEDRRAQAEHEDELRLRRRLRRRARAQAR